jgi:hypothetical protein
VDMVSWVEELTEGDSSWYAARYEIRRALMFGQFDTACRTSGVEQSQTVVQERG